MSKVVGYSKSILLFSLCYAIDFLFSIRFFSFVIIPKLRIQILWLFVIFWIVTDGDKSLFLILTLPWNSNKWSSREEYVGLLVQCLRYTWVKRVTRILLRSWPKILCLFRRINTGTAGDICWKLRHLEYIRFRVLGAVPVAEQFLWRFRKKKKSSILMTRSTLLELFQTANDRK